MLVGHVGAALGARRFAPSVAFAALVFASYLPDWVDAALCVTGKYQNAQMLSHSIPAVLILAVLAGATQLGRADRAATVAVFAVVISHVLLDYITGIKPTWPGGPFIGMQLYSRPLLDLAVESVVIVAGWLVYKRTVPAVSGRWNLSTLMLAVLLVMQAGADALRLLSPSINKC